MRGFVLEDIASVRLTNVRAPRLQAPTDAIVRVRLTSICGSDVHLAHGQIPTEPGFVMGHEYVGVVEEVGSAVRGFRKGMRVTGPAAPRCGHCASCRAGQIQRCLNGGVLGSGKPWGGLGGAQSEHLRMPWADVNLVAVPDALSDEQVLFVGDVLSTGYFAVTQAGLRPGDSVVVLGAGPVGLCAVHAATLFAPRAITAVDLVGSRLRVARRLGATRTIDGSRDDVVSIVMEATGGRGADVVIDAVGAPSTLLQAGEMAAVGGRIALVGIPERTAEVPLSTLFMKNVRLSMGLARLDQMDRMIALIAAGRLDTTPLITHRMRLSQIEQAFRMFEAQEDEVIKIAVRP